MRNSQFSVPKRRLTRGFLKEKDSKASDRLIDNILNTERNGYLVSKELVCTHHNKFPSFS